MLSIILWYGAELQEQKIEKLGFMCIVKRIHQVKRAIWAYTCILKSGMIHVKSSLKGGRKGCNSSPSGVPLLKPLATHLPNANM